MIVVAHRACPRYAAENSIDGIRKARELGADAVEIDVRRTLDGVPILMHDRTAWRTARCPWPVRLMPSGWVRRLRLRGSGAPVPTLRAALAALPAEQRRTVELAYFDGLTQSEIARATGDALGTVKTRIRLGMEKLADALLEARP